MGSAEGNWRVKPLLHPVIRHVLAADRDRLWHDHPESHDLEDRARREARLRVQATQGIYPGGFLDVLEQRSRDSEPQEVRVHVQHVDVTIAFQVRESRDPALKLSDPGRFGLAPSSELYRVDFIRGPCPDLRGRVVA